MAFTLIELLVVLAIIAILAAMLFPALSHSGPSLSSRCMSNQKQIDTACILWAADNAGQFPAQVSIATNGSREFVSSGYASLQFRPLAGYLKYAGVFICPGDKTKSRAESVEKLRDENLSYFINTDAGTNSPANSIMTGDRNLQANGLPVKPGLFVLDPTISVDWTPDIHLHGGILSFADGHVQFETSNDLNGVVKAMPLATNRLCVP